MILLAFWILMLASLARTSQTFDESVYATSGYTFWRFNDYRFNPENGNLPQRLQALPLLFGSYKFISPENEFWRTADKWQLSWAWYYQLGNDAAEMIFRGRAASGIFAVALGLLVWGWSRKIFGALGAMLSLLLYVLNPTVLANGALMTADMAAALFFFAATWAWWRMLHRFTIARLAISSLAMSGLFLSKMSAPLIGVVVLVLAVIRLAKGGALPARGFGISTLQTRGAQLLTFGIAALFHGAVVVVMVWGFHGFRYAAAAPELPDSGWVEAPWERVLDMPLPEIVFERLGLGPSQRREVERTFAENGASLKAWSTPALKAVEAVKRSNVLAEEQVARFNELMAQPPPRLFPRLIDTLRRYRLLPEAYLYGYAHVWLGARERAAFLNGDVSLTGWRSFFPYTFLVKTPLSLFVVQTLALAAVIAWLKRGTSKSVSSVAYEAAPLLVLFVVYWVATLASHLNIGHRHILPTYPPLFVLCGAATWWLRGEPNKARPDARLAFAARGALALAVIFLAAEVCYRFPHYLAYFNGVVTPARAYRHLVDSSLDWGQELPGARDYLAARQFSGPSYLFYFGSANPAYYRVAAIYGHSIHDRHRTPPLEVLNVRATDMERDLREFAEREPEYDQAAAVGARVGDEVSVVIPKKPAALRLTAGRYLISATLLQPVTAPGRGAFGPWNERVEKEYQRLRQFVAPMLSDDVTARQTLLGQYGPETVRGALHSHDYLRFRRLTSFLRQREPEDNIGYSILVYHVREDELARALDGPPVELGRDILSEIFRSPPQPQR